MSTNKLNIESCGNNSVANSNASDTPITPESVFKSEIQEEKPELHFMLDLETLDNKPSSHILELAMVAFDPHTGEINEEHTTKAFFGAFTEQKCGTKSFDTYDWWLRTNPQQFISYFDLNRKTHSYRGTIFAIQEMLEHLRYTHKITVWCTGTFDVDILNYHATAR